MQAPAVVSGNHMINSNLMLDSELIKKKSEAAINRHFTYMQHEGLRAQTQANSSSLAVSQKKFQIKSPNSPLNILKHDMLPQPLSVKFEQNITIDF